jgi:hypothetical protein
MKRTYWCVRSEFFDDGRALAAMHSLKRNKKPKDAFRQWPRMDAYIDYFDSREAAEAFLAQVRALGAAA